MFHRVGIKATVIAAAVMLSTPAAAQTTTFTFTGGNSNLSGPVGNSRTFWNNDNTISVIVTAWSLSTPNGTPSKAYLGWYANGLGVTNANEGDGTDNSSHTIDNVGSYDFVTFGFSRPVQLLMGSLVPYDVTAGGPGADNDPSISFSSDPAMSPSWNANAIVTNTALWNDLKLHTTERPGNLSAAQNYRVNLNPGMNTGNIWTVGANRLLDLYPGRDDGFKLAGFTVQVPVPEPTTWALMIAGFGVVGGSLRRRAARATVTA